MDMDIPDPEELEWLESNSHFQEEDHSDYNSYPYPPDEDLKPQQQQESPPHSPSSPPPRKRLRSDGPGSPIHENIDSIASDEKRSKIDDVEQEVDEDWLRYSPPPPPPPQEVERMEVAVEEKIISKYISEIDGDFIPITAPSGGDRVYAKICRVETEERLKKLDMKSQSNGLISEPVNVLLQRMEQEAFTKALHASSEGQADVVLTGTEMMHEQLWVDKYAPNSFTELLSDEQTNREVLLWLKQWDSCVFGSEIRSTSDDILSSLRRHSTVSQHQKLSHSNFPRRIKGHGWTNGNFRHSNSLDNENSNVKGIQDLWSKKSRLTGPPEQKILLLCGPPGLGKTTLAHVAAKHCGYRVVEVNASDDRSSSTIEAKILDVVQMNSIMADSRPKCLVIDEIDGALGDGKGAVEVILKMVSAERKSNTGKENVAKGDQSGKISAKKGRKTVSLSRPVICICNDLYAPVLRPLRQVAKVHIFVQPTVSRVVNRLKFICKKEGMKVSSIALTALADYAECDIRSCLNTLQFLHNKKQSLHMLEIGSQVVGQKDMSKNVFDIWKEIFQKKKMKRERKSSTGSLSHEFNFLHSLVSNRGDYDVVFDGIHENILQLQYHDPLMQKTVKCFNSLGVSDLINQYIMRTQQMRLYAAYQPPLAIIVHHLVAQVQKPNIEWPKSYQRYRTMLMEKTDILRSWRSKIPPFISRHLSIESLVEDSISPLLHILSPSTLRPVAFHLLSEKEKNGLAQLVSTMVSYSVTYKNMKPNPLSSTQEFEAALDASALSFDPPICDFIKGYNSAHYVLPLAVKQVLVHEVEKEKILQVSRSAHLTDGGSKENLDLANGKHSKLQSANDSTSLSASKIETRNNLLNRHQCKTGDSTKPSNLDFSKSSTSSMKLKSPGNSKPCTGSTSFFDRFRKVSSKSSPNTDIAVQKTTTLERDLRPLLFKFNEGFTNAVKRPVRMREFLL
ncbi:chromosome transmission fidelity protein 18 homolog isoform X3 [Ricinus communis]|uniref:chromosome transmission fidelity protein 18 homolog isoform X3 n=1 Tax=Ricinus communis TaxID=3988 RepID=UPI00201A7C15|nr:chromosome transmission fidelity protein 18 homolog isoform X3 [Ricinus communis]